MPHHHDWHHEGHKGCNYTFSSIGGNIQAHKLQLHLLHHWRQYSSKRAACSPSLALDVLVKHKSCIHTFSSIGGNIQAQELHLHLL